MTSTSDHPAPLLSVVRELEHQLGVLTISVLDTAILAIPEGFAHALHAFQGELCTLRASTAPRALVENRDRYAVSDAR